jgi:hypothetical protein
LVDEGFSSAFGVLNVSRDADLDTIEATFARLYKAARRAAGGDQRRQELNNALETLRDADRRAAVEVDSFHVPLDTHGVVPSIETLARELLPLGELPSATIDEHVLVPGPAQVAAGVLAGLEAPPWPDGAALLRALAARAALEEFDPWEDAGGE